MKSTAAGIRRLNTASVHIGRNFSVKTVDYASRPANMTNVKEIVAETKCGKLRGYIKRSSLGDDYYAFKGIPYAKPPVGPLRFRDPEPAEPWSGIRDALEHGPMSLQYKLEKPDEMIGSEDCLYLNVYARKSNANLYQPVMVWIHGGGFLKHSGDERYYGPDYFMSKDDIVLVTINYRLGVFGFLNLEDEVAPGNQGLKDQVLALHWVKNNISNFGGDPGNVTIFGESAGAASVHYQTLSPLSKGLFHKAICQSGAVFNSWALKRETQKSLNDFLTLLRYNKNREPKAVVEFLRSLDSHKLMEAQEKLSTPQAWLKLNFPFGPCVDDKSRKPFMPIHPKIMAKKAVQIPLMVGYTSFEGLFMLLFLSAIDIKEFDRDFEKYVIVWLTDILKEYKLTLEDIRKMYFRTEEISDKNLEKLLELYSDGIFIEGIHKLLSIQVHSSGAPTYFYKFSYNKNESFFRPMIEVPFKGASHGDELNFQFKNNSFENKSLPQLQEGSAANRIMKQMIELWTSFAKTGRPTPKTSKLIPFYWQPVVNDVVLRYLNIDEELHMENELSISQRYSFKKNISSFQ